MAFFCSSLEHLNKSISSESHRFERQTNEPSSNREINYEPEARTQLPNSSDLQFKSKNFPYINESLVQDIFGGRAVIPTFAEFLEYILSTDLQGRPTLRFKELYYFIGPFGHIYKTIA